VKKSINGFLLNLGTAVLIVIGALLVTMGWRSGLIVGTTLLLTVLGTFILMKIGGWQLHRLSLGALIIALGMLVDNAIVVVEGAMVGVTRGVSKRQACFAIVKQTRLPLLALHALRSIRLGHRADHEGDVLGVDLFPVPELDPGDLVDTLPGGYPDARRRWRW
jgi:multidrug efflux pump subunit AcrB